MRRRRQAATAAAAAALTLLPDGAGKLVNSREGSASCWRAAGAAWGSGAEFASSVTRPCPPPALGDSGSLSLPLP